MIIIKKKLSKTKKVKKMKTNKINQIIIFLILAIAISQVAASQISFCKTQTTVSGNQCCEVCDEKYILNRCECFDEAKHFKFFLMIGHYWFMLFFILIPNIAIGIVFIKFKYDNIAQEDLYLVKARVGRPVEFSEENILNVRKVNCQQME
jgi:hypothetical protein